MVDQGDFKKNLDRVWSAWKKLVAHAWSDEAFKKKMLSDETWLNAALIKAGSPDIPQKIKLKVEEDMEIMQPIVELRDKDAEICLHLFLPPAPSLVKRPSDHRRFCCC